jgi:hypothetical protein
MYGVAPGVGGVEIRATDLLGQSGVGTLTNKGHKLAAWRQML